ncbi:MAG: tRNA (adenosine(37)-N6)-dimethylallyltransferase MiaA [Candidatus Tumulicola sp.]
MTPKVLILAGPTASGKTELAIELARQFGAEIVGADSRQVYRGMPIGTAAPSSQQLAAIPHHCVGFVDPMQRYSAARYASDAVGAIEAIHRRGNRAIVAGGTGFYLRALTGAIALAPEYDETLRRRLAAEARLHPPEFLHEWLAQRDRKRAAELHARDTYRVVRALEIALAGNLRAREGPLRTLASQGIEWLTVFLDVPPAELDARIDRRSAQMLDDGLLSEAERIGELAVAASAVGYPQALAYLRGWSTASELRVSLQRATKRYARRQRAWFRGERDALWLAREAVAPTVREKLGWS